MRRKQFSISDMLAAIALIALGIAITTNFQRFQIYPILNIYRSDDSGMEMFAAYFAGWALVGAGVGLPFRSKTVGAIIGVVGGFVFGFLYFSGLLGYLLSFWH